MPFHNENSLVTCINLEPSDFDSYLTVDGNLITEGPKKSDSTIETESLQTDKKLLAESSAYKSWVENQFSWWDGSHDDFEKLIKKNLNDEKSYKHIKTRYIDVTDDDLLNTVTELVSLTNSAIEVEMGDLFLICDFSAKNAFNATIKNTAYGLVKYSDNSMYLLTVE